jgi:hypothetical protein
MEKYRLALIKLSPKELPYFRACPALEGRYGKGVQN